MCMSRICQKDSFSDMSMFMPVILTDIQSPGVKMYAAATNNANKCLVIILMKVFQSILFYCVSL